MIVSETTPEDHLIVLREFLMDIKAHTMNSSIWVQVNYWRVSSPQADVKLYLSCTV